MSILADHHRFIIGVDTHAATHILRDLGVALEQTSGAGNLSNHERRLGTLGSLDWAPHRR
ncbi:hypothetical protein [Glutamicibacter sp. NPDC087583]|uniref:hypothetical protein n=1 Tax=Glutamicibacter sp. NPDC087583 TaxID=3363995 RepID=UPI0037F9BCE3